MLGKPYLTSEMYSTKNIRQEACTLNSLAHGIQQVTSVVVPRSASHVITITCVCLDRKSTTGYGTIALD